MAIAGSPLKDVTVVGASVTGLFTAARLAGKGMDVALIERNRQLAPAARSLIVTHRFREFAGPVADSAVVHQINGFELFADGKVGSFSLAKPDLIIERSVLIRELEKEAKRAGVDVRYGSRFGGFRPERGRLHVELDRRSEDPSPFATRTLVGADGAFSRVGRAAGWPVQPTVSLVQTEVELPPNQAPDVTRVWFLPEETPYFFWLIPHSENRGVLGLIGTDKRDTIAALHGFLRVRGVEPGPFQAAVIPEYRRWIPMRRRFEGSDVFLVGDAAGHVKVSTVGGIVTGFRGAEAAIAAIAGRDGRARQRSLRRELGVHLAIRKALDRFEEKDYKYLIDHLDARARVSLESIDRDQGLRIMFDLCRRRPQLILRGLRALLGGPKSKTVVGTPRLEPQDG